MASMAGHDLNYLALSGALHAMGSPDRPPTPPLNLVADFGGGGLMLAFGMVSAILHARQTGAGQVVDATMVDGCATLATMFFALRRMGVWMDQRGHNFLDGGAHFYRCYTCADGKFISVGAIEAKFYAVLLNGLGITKPEDCPQFPPTEWPALRQKFAEIFKTKSRDEWWRIFENTDACVAPVLSFEEAVHHPHNQARGTFPSIFGEVQPGPTPRFSGTPAEVRRPPPQPGADRDDILSDWGVDP